MSARAGLHRSLWQRLPYYWRRAALFSATALLAPRTSARPTSTLPIIVVGTLRAATGLGQAARLCHDALKSTGLPVYGIDVSGILMQPTDFSGFAFDDGTTQLGGGTVILHINGPFVPLALIALGRAFVAEKRIIGCWAWELPVVPREWRNGVRFVSEIWVPSNFVATALQPISMGRPIRTLPHPLASGLLPRMTGRLSPEQRPFTVLTIFNMASSLARKNPVAAIRAFQSAFAKDAKAQLIVKFLNGAAFPNGELELREVATAAENISFVGEALDNAAMADLYDTADVVLSLHRSEGFGLTIGEAMLRGIPVVATNWSGNVDFLNPSNGVPIGYDLVPARDPQGTYEHPSMLWAEPRISEAAAALRALRADPAMRLRLGQAASLQAHALFGAQVYAAKARAALGL